MQTKSKARGFFCSYHESRRLRSGISILLWSRLPHTRRACGIGTLERCALSGTMRPNVRHDLRWARLLFSYPGVHARVGVVALAPQTVS